ncbi:hypothetical protein SAMN05421837_11195 [Amycolatopsis pretoriensis]|uniref:PPE family protein n=1 Tax=Amycolatopsis pretoriensis TaxID=218821 RepID=A0A1H5RF71_9PSEU|nr:hypothetical protein [Amycolatopsis pretoriensis]SEF36674.1 hypothetical protein SAMN05421837_11195 [Amycolatopsis pretoriensis]
MSQPHRAQHRQSEGDYYAETSQKLQGHGSDGQRATQQAASDYSVAQGKLLQQGQSLRGDSPAPGENYANSPHEVLYDMVHKDLDIEGINDRSRVANVYGNWLADASNQFRDAATAAGGSWQGPAAEQANGFFQNTASHTEQTGDAMQLVSNHYSQQSAAAHYAKTNMPEPTGFDQQAELDKAKQQYNSGNLIGMSSTMAGIQAKQQQADAAHQQAVQVLQNLDGTYHETASSQPTYAPPPQLGNGDSTSVSGFHGTSSTSFTGTPTIGGTGPGGTSGTYIPGGTTPPGVAPPGTTPPSFVQPGTTSGVGGTNFTGGNTNFRATPAASGFPRMTPDGLAIPPGTPGGSTGGDTVRGKSGVGRAGSGFAGSRVSGGGLTGAPKEAAGEGKAAGAGKTGGKAPGERLERGATAAAAAKGKGATAGAAGAGAGKKKEDDKEHKNKFAVDEDVFDLKPERGPDGEKIVKPTIGEA